MRSIALVSVLVGFACGHPPGPNGNSPKGTPTEAKPKGEFPKGPPLVSPGERMQYRVSLKGIELASYVIAVGEVVDLEGRKAITVQGNAKLAGLAAWFGGKVDDKLTSWIDVETGRSRRFQVDEYGSKSTDIEHTVAEIAKREGNVIPVTFHINEDPPQPEPQKAALPETWCLNAFLVALRSWEGPPGTVVNLEVFRSRNLWKMTVTIKGKTKLVTELGELPALRFDAHVVKLDREGGKFPDTDERDFSLWVSDDAGRVPLQINAKTDYGDVTMAIVDYQAGNGEPLRK
ncbi:MAG: DUF3108 domain-containing protein [Deltaproteobacteria bacterium]|nr:DUF3108 domain-containing protein [Deltaproteobacteria bacterium]